MPKGTTLEDVTRRARGVGSGTKLRATRGGNVLVFSVSCWIAAMVIRPLLERDGWKVEEVLEQ